MSSTTKEADRGCLPPGRRLAERTCYYDEGWQKVSTITKEEGGWQRVSETMKEAGRGSLKPRMRLAEGVSIKEG